MINNHKLINFFQIGLAILFSGVLFTILSRHLWGKLILPLIITGLTFSGLIDFFPIVNDYSLTVPDLPQNPTAQWIVLSTPPESVFLTSTYLYNSASLAGRKTFEDYGYFNWSMGYNDRERRQKISSLFSSNLPDSIVCSFLIQNNLEYTLINQGGGDLGELDPHQSVIATRFKPAYQSTTGDAIYATSQNCP